MSLQSLYERQGVAVVPPTVPGPYLGIPKGTMRKQKSIGEEKHTYSTVLCVIIHNAGNNIAGPVICFFLS